MSKWKIIYLDFNNDLCETVFEIYDFSELNNIIVNNGIQLRAIFKIERVSQVIDEN